MKPIPGSRAILSRDQVLSRRRFLNQSACAAGALSLLGEGSLLRATPRNKNLPTPQRSGIEHIVLVMMENRSFDHFLGWLPGAEGRQAGLRFTDSAGNTFSTAPLAPDYQGCSHPDPDHSYQGGRIEFDNGACDGWLRAGTNDRYSIGYYTQSDLGFLGQMAPAWTVCDQYFAAIMAPTYPNRIYQHAAQTDRLEDSLLPLSTLPTIWDRLADHSLPARYYFSDFPILAFWGATYVPIARLITDFFADCAAGTLPAVSFVDPRFIGEVQGFSGDDHPHGDIRDGEFFLNSVYAAVTASPNWANTVLIINFDEWGGFFDHVPPGIAPVPSSDATLGSDGRVGFRVPALVISPWSPRGVVAHGIYDHTSVLKMIEWRWNLRPLTVRDATANNLAEVLNFTNPDLTAPQLAAIPPTFGVPCLPGLGISPEELALLELVASLGFPVP